MHYYYLIVEHYGTTLIHYDNHYGTTFISYDNPQMQNDRDQDVKFGICDWCPVLLLPQCMRMIHFRLPPMDGIPWPLSMYHPMQLQAVLVFL